MPGKIILKGIRVHNLKNIDLEIPRDQLIVITGVSGSGKSSLAFDTLYAEGQRRYLDSLSAYARQVLDVMQKPDVDSIEGLSPTIAVGQKNASRNLRSTVGTATEIYDYLRLLFARVGKPVCYRCGREISAHTIQQIVDRILALSPESRVHILAPIVSGQKSDLRREIKELSRAGFSRVRIGGAIYALDSETVPDDEQSRPLDLVVDRVSFRAGIEKRLADSLEVAARYGGGLIKLEVLEHEPSNKVKEFLFSLKLVCVQCGISYPEFSPSMFSFNSPRGACGACGGLGVEVKGSDADEESDKFTEAPPCSQCNGARLRTESLHVKVGGKNIAEITSLTLKELSEFFDSLSLGRQDQIIARRLITEMTARIEFLTELGLDYLTLNRSSITLSGGEAERIRLATQMGANLVGVLYILDEPSIGLHQRDNARLIRILKRLRDGGNTVLVVEHDQETILEADQVIDMGPGAGVTGGKVVAQGSPQEISASDVSLTGQYLSGRLEIPVPRSRRKGSGHYLLLRGARRNNLKNISVKFPLGTLTCVTGVSGSGKTSLVVDILSQAKAKQFDSSAGRGVRDITGLEQVDRIINIDQSPIGRTPRSNPATYTGIFDQIRALFAQIPDARLRGYGPGRFSFNVKGGRCEACQGDGLIRIEMQFLPAVYVTCDVCEGRRYNRETLEVKYKGRSIADFLELTVTQASEVLANLPLASEKLAALREIGLGYIQLGQAATTLSGGEAQRVKLARELSKKSKGQTLYILDEPTTGLHFEDVKKLLEVLNRLTDVGNTVIIVEHNLDVIKSADYVVDLGPEGGELGGEVVAYGTPEELALVEKSYTGRYLGKILQKRAQNTLF
ncbi:MAG: excinuclease ABC subunit UvrA [Deltaproteobacteria bacterium]|nr:excinuclease ABC subunit UvrA [Deltaproteobacteria bacterium]